MGLGYLMKATLIHSQVQKCSVEAECGIGKEHYSHVHCNRNGNDISINSNYLQMSIQCI